MTLEEISKKIKHYEELAQKNYYAYQQTGDPRYDRYEAKYTELADVYRMAYKYESDREDTQLVRLHNFTYYIEEHIQNRTKETFTKKEVLDMAEHMKQFVL